MSRSTEIAKTEKDPRRQEAGTPQWAFNALNKVYSFTVDGMACAHNKKMIRYWGPRQDVFKQRWNGERIFINPPFSRAAEVVQLTTDWICISSPPELVALWLPGNPFGKWWVQVHKWVDHLITFNRRIQHDPPPGIEYSSPGGGIMVAVFKPRKRQRRKGTPIPTYLWNVRDIK